MQANAAIGRAVRLALRILGGATPGGMDAATMGQPAKLGLCFAENEPASPWRPFHTERGFAAEAGVVTAAGISGTVEVVFGESADAEEIRDYCRGKIATYKIPRYVKFVDDFPMTVTGKVQKFKMREQAVEELGLERAAKIEMA